MSEELTLGWTPVHVGIEGDAISLNGINPWKFEWKRILEEPIIVPHPSHLHERHQAWVYEVESSGKRLRFAAGELSPNVWGFYLPSRKET